jgi:Ring finger domain
MSNNAADATSPELSSRALDYDIEEDADYVAVLRLPIETVDADRKVQGVCAICLCAYENGEEISWSPEPDCQHVFHTDCIVAWLAKKDQPQCPVCRQDFCHLPAITVEENQQPETYPRYPLVFSHNLSQVMARSLERRFPEDVRTNGLARTTAIVAAPDTTSTPSQNDHESDLQDVSLRDNNDVLPVPSTSSRTISFQTPDDRQSLEVEQGNVYL